MIRLLYNFLWPIGLLVFLPAYLRRMIRRGGFRENFGQRLGLYSAADRSRRRSSTWIHAVSVGEIAVALKIAHSLRALEPELNCVLTTTTTTGRAYAEKMAPAWIQIFYAPLDFWPVMRRAFRFINPRRIILVEAEVWPNMVARAKSCGLPVVLANARLSPRSARRFHRFRHLVRPLFRQLTLICVTDEADAALWRELGGANLAVTGNVKYDLTAQAAPVVPPALPVFAGPVLLGASTHRGEEEILARVFLSLRPQFDGLRLVIVPRHVERAAAIIRRLQDLGLAVRRRTESVEGECLLVDTTGELRAWLPLATVVFVGKSLAARGGQNPVEALAAERPVLFGPNMQNFERISEQLVSVGGARVIRNEEEMRAVARELLADEQSRVEMVRKAQTILLQHQGAAARTAHAIRSVSALE